MVMIEKSLFMFIADYCRFIADLLLSIADLLW